MTSHGAHCRPVALRASRHHDGDDHDYEQDGVFHEDEEDD